VSHGSLSPGNRIKKDGENQVKKINNKYTTLYMK